MGDADIVTETRKLLENPNVSWYAGQRVREILAQFCGIVESLQVEIANLSVCDRCVQDATVRACRTHAANPPPEPEKRGRR